jgi:hypothetical protein
MVRKFKIFENLEMLAPFILANVYWLDMKNVVLGGNELAAKFIGSKNPEDFIGKTLYEYYPKAIADDMVKYHGEVVVTGKPLSQKASIQDVVTGKVKYFNIIIAPLREDEQIVGSISIAIETTAEKTAEYLKVETEQQEIKSQPKQTEKIHDTIALQSVNTVKSDADITSANTAKIAKTEPSECLARDTLVTTQNDCDDKIWQIWRKIYHDFVGQLAISNMSTECLEEALPLLIAGYKSAILHETIEEGNTEILSNLQLKGLQHSASSISDVNKTLRWFLAVYRMLFNPLAKDAFNLNTCSIAHCLDEAFTEFPVSSLYNITLLNAPTVTDFSFLGHEDLMKHVLFNLLDNALYKIAVSGDLSAEKIKLFTTYDADCNYLHFRDMCGSVTPEIKAKLFTKYFTTKTNKIGLGLYFCKKAMHYIAGDIICNSDETIGYTEFVLQFKK